MECPRRPQMISHWTGHETLYMPAVVKAMHTTPVPAVHETGPIPRTGTLRSHQEWNGKGTLWDDTVYQVEGLVEAYHAIYGYYPYGIWLSASRNLAAQEHTYYPEDLRLNPVKVKYYPRDHSAAAIHYHYEAGSSYEILLR